MIDISSWGITLASIAASLNALSNYYFVKSSGKFSNNNTILSWFLGLYLGTFSELDDDSDYETETETEDDGLDKLDDEYFLFFLF